MRPPPLGRNAARGLDISCVYELAMAWSKGQHWWERLAALLVEEGRFWVYGTRTPGGLYLARMWVSPPRLAAPKSKDGSAPYDAERSLLLHYFFRGDDDKALHDHPWWFRTQILAGGYHEHLPSVSWRPGSELGPAWDKRVIFRAKDDVVVHQAADLHCVGLIEPGTFTLVQTGAEVREWGFHPPGKPWVPSRVFLDPNRIETERITRAHASASSSPQEA